MNMQVFDWPHTRFHWVARSEDGIFFYSCRSWGNWCIFSIFWAKFAPHFSNTVTCVPWCHGGVPIWRCFLSLRNLVVCGPPGWSRLQEGPRLTADCRFLWSGAHISLGRPGIIYGFFFKKKIVSHNAYSPFIYSPFWNKIKMNDYAKRPHCLLNIVLYCIMYFCSKMIKFFAAASFGDKNASFFISVLGTWRYLNTFLTNFYAFQGFQVFCRFKNSKLGLAQVVNWVHESVGYSPQGERGVCSIALLPWCALLFSCSSNYFLFTGVFTNIILSFTCL